MSDWKFHCDVLSVPETASPEEIKAAFRKLALKHHPDRNGGTPQSKEKFQRLNISYRYLMRNYAHRPQPEAPPPHTAHPPPPPFTRREAIRGRPAAKTAPREGWLERIVRFLTSTPPEIPVPRIWRTRRDDLLQIFPAATAGLAAMISVFVFVSHNLPEKEPERAPASRHVDNFGRPVARCELMSFQGGSLKDKSVREESKWDCELRCMDWFTGHAAYDNSCLWKREEFRSAKAPRVPVYVPPPPQPQASHAGLRPDGFYDDFDKWPEFLYAQETPDIDGSVPFRTKTIAIDQDDELTLDVTPRIWISDSRLLWGGAGTKRQQVILHPKGRAGEVEVVITDLKDQPIARYLYTIRRVPSPGNP